MTSEMRSAITAVCERLVHPAQVDPAVRAIQTRLIALLLAGPFALAATLWIVVSPIAGLSVALALVAAIFGASWIGALLIAATGRHATVAAAALGIAAVGGAALLATGGFASPLALLVLALPLEAWLVCRTSRAATAGAGASAAALLLASLTLYDAPSPTAWHWLPLLAYGALVAPRLRPALSAVAQMEATPTASAAEALRDTAALTFSPQGEVLDCAGATPFGLATELLDGTGLFERVHISDRLGWLSALADMRDGAERRSVELRLRLPRPGGRIGAEAWGVVTVELLARPAPSPFLTGLMRESTIMPALRAELGEARAAAERLDLAKGRFLAAVSHELRTPLNSIIGFSDMLLHEMFGGFRDPRQKEYVELVRDSGHHLLAVVNSILDVSRIEAGSYATNPEPFRFVEAVASCTAMMSVQAEAKRIALQTRLGADLGEVHADRRAVQQILINLVSNAVKFTPEGGEVTIGARRGAARLTFWVTDNGIGIGEEDLARLGRPFTQVQNDYTRQFEGAGLGLSLVKGLVGLHEGTMTIDSTLGEGTTVTITLPLEGPARKGAGGEVVAMKAQAMREEGHGALRKAG